MLRQIRIGNNLASKLFDLDAVSGEDELIITNISGLSPSDIEIQSGDFTGDGGYIQGTRLAKRNVVFTFSINPQYATNRSVGKIRNDLYTSLFAQGGIYIYLWDDDYPGFDKDSMLPNIILNGTVDSINTEMMVKDLTAQVSVLVPYPYLKAYLPYSKYYDPTETGVTEPYEANAPSGISVRLEVMSPVNIVRLGSNNPGAWDSELMTLVHPTSFATDDIIDIMTQPGERAILVNGEDKMAYLQPESPWIMAYKDPLKLFAYSSYAFDGKVNIRALSYRLRYWGI